MRRGINSRWSFARDRAKLASSLLFLIPTAAIAGPYSTGLQNTNSGAVDPGVAGFINDQINPAFVGWATGYSNYLPGGTVGSGWNDPTVAIGPVSGDNFDIVSLGESTTNPGKITLSFKSGIRNAAGADFAVFENAFGSNTSVFAELAYVEVSSDGSHFARFPNASLTANPIHGLGFVDPTNIRNLAGKHINSGGDSYGTPFDLSDLTNDPLVLSGQVNLRAIDYVRLIDIAGDGSSLDSSGRPIYDSYPTSDSAGFDLQAVGVLNSWMPGDANFDGIVDGKDLGRLAVNWQQQQGDFGQGDFNHDGVVDVDDLYLLATNWQRNEVLGLGAQPFSVPEPTMPALLLAAALFRRRR